MKRLMVILVGVAAVAGGVWAFHNVLESPNPYGLLALLYVFALMLGVSPTTEPLGQVVETSSEPQVVVLPRRRPRRNRFETARIPA